MIDHISIGVSDFARSRAFYKAALGALGYELLREFSAEVTGHVDVAGFGERGKPDLWLGSHGAQEPRLHVALRAPTRAAVDAFHRAALEAGGRDNGLPGLRPQYHANYYGAFVLDPDGHNIEAVCHTPEPAPGPRMAPQLNVVTLGARDLPALRRFYAEGLGWPAAASSNEHVAFIQTGGVVLALFGHGELAEDASVSAEGSGFKGFSLAQNVRSEADVDAALAAAEAAGGKVLKPGQKVFWGGYSGYFSDPEGNLWEVAFNPFWELDLWGLVKLA